MSHPTIPPQIPSLFDCVEGNTVRQIQGELEDRNAEWMRQVRTRFAFYYFGRRVTTDDVWAFMDSEAIDLPQGTSPKLLGSFFVRWDRARPVFDEDGNRVFVTSKRKGAHANLLRQWEIV